MPAISTISARLSTTEPFKQVSPLNDIHAGGVPHGTPPALLYPNGIGSKRKETALKKILIKIWNDLEIYAMVVLMIGFILTVLWGIISRLIFHSPATWSEEVARFMFIWMVFLGISYSTLHDSHIRVTFVADTLFKGRSRQVLDIFIQLLTLAIFGWMFITGIRYVDYCMGVKTPALQMPRGWFVTILPITGGLMVIRTAYKLGVSVKKLFSNKEEVSA